MNALAMDYNSIRSFTMTLAHRAVGDIRRGGFRQLRNYVDMCATLAKNQQQKDFLLRAEGSAAHGQLLLQPYPPSVGFRG